jgi:hypothetical protein
MGCLYTKTRSYEHLRGLNMPKPTVNPMVYRIDGWTVYLIVTLYTSDNMNYEIINAIPDLLIINGEYQSLDVIELESEIFRHLKVLNPGVE